MRHAGLLLVVGAVTGAGCFGPFSWPDDRRASASLPEVDALTLAADCLERGDEAAAVPHFRTHVQAHPDAVMIRAHLAELLYRQDRSAEARREFERVVADAQSGSGPARNHLVHTHTRLMELSAEADDVYAEALHRGIGLLLLVKRWDADPTRADAKLAEQTLAKAVAALRSAREARPADARVNFYLGETYARLGQGAAAKAAYQAAAAGLPDPAVTPTERDRIAAATISR